VVIAAAPMIGILILPARLVLSATALSSMLLGGLCYASVIGRVPYAPLFKQQVLGESVTYGAFYFWSQICFVVPFLVIIIAAAHLFLTQWRARESHVRYISQTDGLTGVYNRRFAHQYLTESIQEADQQPVGVVLMDLDHFKLINDRHGHLIGDDALRLTANTLREHLRSEDVVARFGGEEFILIFQNTDLAAAMSLAERCRIQIEQMMLYNANGAVPITASFGVTCASHSGQAVDDLLQEADDALYLAKKRGRNQVAAAHEIAATVENKQSVIVLAK
jgi:diguanylate cyclase (GGDEF)-like protein